MQIEMDLDTLTPELLAMERVVKSLDKPNCKTARIIALRNFTTERLKGELNA